MTAIAIDLGDKRCGIATEVSGIAFPKEIALRHELTQIIKKYIQGGSYDTIVVGLPHDLYGKEKKQLDKTQDFITKLENIFPDIKIVGIDERFSSFAADQTLRELGSKNNQGQKDALAAAEILQTYLDQKK